MPRPASPSRLLLPLALLAALAAAGCHVDARGDGRVAGSAGGGKDGAITRASTIAVDGPGVGRLETSRRRVPLVEPGAAAAEADGGGRSGRPFDPAAAWTPDVDFPEGSVRIGYAGPSGPVDLPNQVVVAFDRPMTPLAALDDPSSVPPVTLSPAVPGRWRWAGTGTATFTPEGRFPAATDFTVSVPAGVKAIDGATLAVPVRFAFQTPRPEVEDAGPGEGSDQAPLDQKVVLTFNQKVDPQAVGSSLTWAMEGGPRVPFDVRRPVFPPSEHPLPEGLLARRVELVPGRLLAPHTRYVVRAEAGLRGAEGPLGMEAPFELRFSTYPPLALVESPDGGAGVEPTDSFRLEFSTPVSEAQLWGNARIEPAVELPKPPEQGEGNIDTRHWVWLYLQPRTTYTLTLSGAIQDVHGQKLGKDAVLRFTTGDRDPLMEMAGSFQVIPAYQRVTVPVLYRNLDDLSVSTARLDPETALALVSKHEWRLWSGADLDRSTPARDGLPVSWDFAESAPLAPADNVPHHHEIDLDTALKGRRHGLVLVEAASQTTHRSWGGTVGATRALFQVTDLGITLKVGLDGSAIWVTSLQTGQPVQGAAVALYVGGKPLWRGKTGPDGTAEAPGAVALVGAEELWKAGEVKAVARAGDDAAIAYGEWSGDYRPWSFGVMAQGESTRFPRAQAFIDRGVYRLGDEVNVKGYARSLVAGQVTGAPGIPFEWRATDGNGDEIGTGKGVLDAFGAFDATFPIPKKAALGSLGVQFTARFPQPGKADANASAYASALIAAYRAPAFRVDAHAERSEIVAGEELRASVVARYLFGAPMRGAKVRYDLQASPTSFTPPGWDGYAIGQQPEWWDGEGFEGATTLESREVEAGADGTVAVAVVVPASGHGPRQAVLSAEVTDLDRQTLSGTASALVHPASWYLAVKARGFLVRAGDELPVEVAAVDPGGAVVPRSKATVKVIRRTWDSVRQKGMDGIWTWQTTVNDEVVGEQKVNLSAGRGTVQVQAPTPGYYLVRAEAVDPQGRAIVTDTSFYGFGSGSVAWARDDSKQIELVPDKPLYQVGDTARVLVKAPFAPARALVTVEREGVLERRVVELSGTADTLEIPLSPAYVPDVYVGVVLVRGGQGRVGPEGERPDFRIGYARLNVDPKGSHLAVEVTPDRPEYGPRDEVKVRVKVADPAGVPVDAQVALYAVDHGVLSLTGYRTPDPFHAFYAPHGLGVLTFASAAELFDRSLYLGKGGAPGGGGGGEEGGAELRSEFRTVAAWLPRVETGPDGVAEARFTLPDNLTTFRIMAVAVDRGSRFGSGEQEVRVSRPVIARPALPRFLRPGDELRAGVVVHNNTGADGEAVVTVDAHEGVDLSGPRTRTVAIPRGGSVEVPFAFSRPAESGVTLRFSVAMGGHADTVEAKLPVIVDRPMEVVQTFAEAAPRAVERVKAPPGKGGEGGLEVDLGTTLLTGLGAPMDYLVEYPYGCIEQTVSRTLPVALMLDLLDRAGVDRPKEQLVAVVRAGIERLGKFSTGRGLAYWPGGEPEPYASAYALLAMGVLQGPEWEAHGVDPVPHDLVVEAQDYLARWLNGQEPSPWWWDPDTKRAARGLALLALARTGKGDPGHNGRLYQEWRDLPLFAQAQLATAILATGGKDAPDVAREALRLISARVVVEPTTAHFEEADDDEFAGLWSSDGRTTGIVALALMEADPAHPLLPRVIRWIAESRRHGRWGNTQETAYALMALREWAVRNEKEVPDLLATVTMGTDALLREVLKGRGATAEARVDLERLRAAGEADLAIEKKGAGRLYYTATLRYPAPEDAPARDEGFTVTRRYEVLEGLGSDQSLDPGALVRVTLTVATPFERHFVAVEDPLPAGLEAVDSAFATTSRRYDEYGGGDDETEWWEVPTFNHVELHDDRAVLFADWMTAGVHTYRYLARATSPGIFDAPPPRAEQMYAPSTFGRGEGGALVVQEQRVAGR